MFASPARKRAEKRGRRAEYWAGLMLLSKGFRPLERRVKTPQGEIDLIVKRGKIIVFVEVKARETRDKAISAISRRQGQRIVAAARIWLSRNGQYHDYDCRFDVVLVTPFRWPNHLVNAFGDGVW